MKTGTLNLFLLAVLTAFTYVQSSGRQQKPDEIAIRISTQLVQIDAAVTDKNDQIVRDLKIENFELFEDGKKQEIKFIEFVDVKTGQRFRSGRSAPTAATLKAEPPATDLTAGSLRRVIAFVVDDLTIPQQDMATVRQMLSNFVENQMGEGDLVSIARTVGGRALLEQFTSDRNLLRRGIASLNTVSHSFMISNRSEPLIATSELAAQLGGGSAGGGAPTTDDTRNSLRGLMALSTSSYILDSLRDLPGRKTMVLVSGGLPLFENRAGAVFADVSTFLDQLADKAARAGVVINTMDVRGLNATPGVGSFVDNPAKGVIGGGGSPGEGRFGQSLDPTIRNDNSQMGAQMGLRVLAGASGGQAVIHTNNFQEGLARVLNRGAGYYLLAYTPENENFDGKFRKIQVKVKRDGVKVYTREGYLAKEDSESAKPKTKEEEVWRAVRSPLASRDLNFSANLLFKNEAANKATLDIHLLIDAGKLRFAQSDGKYQTSLDVVGFVYDQVGKPRGGFSETLNGALSEESYKKALATGIHHTASTQVGSGFYQLRIAVRETATGQMGTLSRYFEIPNLSNGQLAMSTIFLYSADPNSAAQPVPLLASTQISRKQDLRYAAIVYNAKLDKGKPQVTSQTIISQNGKILFKEPEQPVTVNIP
ncbi:MAG: VWA domain-containing protein, partial [Blastocatellia bacterium]